MVIAVARPRVRQRPHRPRGPRAASSARPGAPTRYAPTLAAYRELWARLPASATTRCATSAPPCSTRSAAYAPDLRAEMAGIADGSGLAEWEVGALNARSELLALGDQRLIAAGLLPGEGLSECSTLVRLDAPATTEPVGRADHRADLGLAHPAAPTTGSAGACGSPDGRERATRSPSTASSARSGWRAGPTAARRLSVHFNALRHGADTGTGGVPVHVVARRILDEARDRRRRAGDRRQGRGHAPRRR